MAHAETPDDPVHCSPSPSSEWPAPDKRHYLLRTKKRCRRRKVDRLDQTIIIGSFKLPERPRHLTGFREPRRAIAQDSLSSPETPIYLCKDGFEKTECIPGRNSAFVPRNRHREFLGLGPLSLGHSISALADSPAQLSFPLSANLQFPAEDRE